jgi:phospholipid-transporting ATPase
MNEENIIKRSPKRRSTIIIYTLGVYQFYINNAEKNHKEFQFQSNEIDTRKYNCITFLPKSLFYQFNRPANIYFLICAILQCIPMISPLGPTSAILPLVIVLSASLIREAIEDIARGRLDKQQNEEKCDKYNIQTNKWEETQSGKLFVGDIISVLEGETFPADIILLDSNLPEGICYIETGTLDGEKTLKMKESSLQTAGWLNSNGKKREGFNLSGNVLADMPNPELYRLNGKMHLKFLQEVNNNNLSVLDVPLDSKQLLLKGAKLKNTEWVIGIVVYSGSNCKIMKNSKEPIPKYSSVEKLMNTSLIFIFIFQAILCLISAILSFIYYQSNLKDSKEGFGYIKYEKKIESFFIYFTYLLLLNTMIPISLIITIEVVKLFQGLFMSYDKFSYSKIRKKFLTPNSVSLNEECGLVNYIFSDKTGTLTCNKMEFKYCVIGETCYQYIRNSNELQIEKDNDFRKEENIIPFLKYEMYDNFKKKETNLNFNKTNHSSYLIRSELNPDLKLTLNSDELIVEQFWLALSLCHTCSIQTNEEGKDEYACISPDSIELVKAARDQGWGLIESGTTSIKRIKLGYDSDVTVDFERLQLIEFSSDRKRETIIVKEKVEGNENESIIKLYCKGADSIIEKRLSDKTPQNTLKQSKYYVNKFSDLGFRTLFIAMKILSEQEYETFKTALNEAQLSLENKDEKVAAVYETIEKDLFLLGATIVEDKLQDLVPETIRDLRLAKIKVWMLTGDKMNTAENIGLSCNLISKKMKVFKICGVDKNKNEKLEDTNREEREQVISDFAKEFNGFKGQFNSLEKPSFGLLVDEKALLTISESEEMQHIFLEIAKDAEAVICCRVSPLQKSQVVKMMKNYDEKGITLAIGDGGNDVPMIMEAHIGIGIYGEEGLRAVQSSDYAVGEFKVLRELLFRHGRTNYIRITECIHYFFFKNFVETFNQFLFGFYCNFTGQTIIDDWFITLFNLLFTSLPLGTKAILDMDITVDDGSIIYKLLPFIYKENRENPYFTIFNFILTLFKGLIFSTINCFIVIYSINNTQINEDGKMAGLWFMSVDIYTNILITVTLTLLITTKYHTWIHFTILFVVSFLSYIIFLVLVQRMTLFNSVGTMTVAFRSPILWLNVFVVSSACGLIEYSILCFYFVFRPSTVTILQRIFNESGKIDNKDYLPKSIKEKLDIYDSIDEKVEDKIIDTNKVETQKIEEIDDKKTDAKIKDETEIKSNGRKSISKGEDENSQDALIKKKFENITTTNGVDIIVLNQGNNEEKINENEELGENLSENVSEQMSKEKNLYFTQDTYFPEQWNFNQKIIQSKTKFKGE